MRLMAQPPPPDRQYNLTVLETAVMVSQNTCPLVAKYILALDARLRLSTRTAASCRQQSCYEWHLQHGINIFNMGDQWVFMYNMLGQAVYTGASREAIGLLLGLQTADQRFAAVDFGAAIGAALALPKVEMADFVLQRGVAQTMHDPPVDAASDDPRHRPVCALTHMAMYYASTYGQPALLQQAASLAAEHHCRPRWLLEQPLLASSLTDRPHGLHFDQSPAAIVHNGVARRGPETRAALDALLSADD